MDSTDAARKARLAAFNARLRECRACHAAGFLDERESRPVAFDAEADSPLPRILLIGQAPGLNGIVRDRPFAGPSGDRLRAWFEAGRRARRETDSPGRSSVPSAATGSMRSSP
jgi:uracil-DNA glycosylase